MTSSRLQVKDIVEQVRNETDEFFKKYDTDGDKKLYPKEFVKYMREISGGGKSESSLIRSAHSAFKKIDLNDDDIISVEELKNILTDYYKNNDPADIFWDKVDYMLEELELNKGKLPKSELIEELTKNGEENPEKLVDLIYLEFDEDNDGFIDYDEFKNLEGTRRKLPSQ